MNGPAREDILHFIEQASRQRLTPLQEADVLAALDYDGEKATLFMGSFAKEFSVDLAGYEAGFHHRDQKHHLRPGWPLPSPYLFGVRVPIPVSTLVVAAKTGRWPVRYPVLKAAPSRPWLNVPLILIGLPLLGMAVLAVFRLL